MEEGVRESEVILIRRAQRSANSVSGRVIKPPFTGQISPYRSRNTDLLRSLRRTREETSAIELLYKQHPDVSKAVQNFMRLANAGHEMEFFDKSGERMSKIEREWNEDFAPRVNAISNAGLDGLVDIAHKSAILFGAMGTEIEPTSDLEDIVDIHPVNPRWIDWERQGFDWRPFQYQEGHKVYVDTPNFCWIPTDPDIDDPRGNLMFTPSLFAVDMQLQMLADIAVVIHTLGFPRQDIEIDLEKAVQLARSLGKTQQAEVEGFLDDWIDKLHSQFSSLEPDSVFIHYNDSKYNLTKGANERGGMDVRAITELMDVFILNGLGQMGVFQNRTSGITETWGTVQFKIFVGVVDSLRRGTKRLIESNARIWARVKGYQARPVFTHKVIDWEAEETRWAVKILEQAWNIANQEMGWVDEDEAAQNVVGHEAEGRKEDADTHGASSSRFVVVEKAIKEMFQKRIG